MKKALSFILAVALLLVCLPLSASAETSGKCGENLTWSYDAETYTMTIEGYGDMYDDMRDLMTAWEESKLDIRKLVLPSGISSIGKWAFRYINITELTIPNSVREITSGAFMGCDQLTSVFIPSSVKKVVGAFSSCGGLTHVSIAEGVELITGSFGTCGNLKTAILPQSVTNLDGSFKWCPSLTLYAPHGSKAQTYANNNEINLGSVSSAPSPSVSSAPQWTNRFTDVKKGSWYEKAVGYMNLNGYISGTEATKFEPDETTTRAMFVTILGRMNGISNDEYASKYAFSDAAPNWAKGYIAWASENEIASGVGDNKFDPDGKVTREQAATFLYRFAQKNGAFAINASAVNRFPDAWKASAYAKEPLSWAIENGIISGSDGKLIPDGNATRAQIAQIFVNYEKNSGKEVAIDIPLRPSSATDTKTKAYAAYYKLLQTELDYLGMPVTDNPFYNNFPYLSDSDEDPRITSIKTALYDVTGDGIEELLIYRSYMPNFSDAFRYKPDYNVYSHTTVWYSYSDGEVKIIDDFSMLDKVYLCKGNNGKVYLTQTKPSLTEGTYSSVGVCQYVGGDYFTLYEYNGTKKKECVTFYSKFYRSVISNFGVYEYYKETAATGSTPAMLTVYNRYRFSDYRREAYQYIGGGYQEIGYTLFDSTMAKLKAVAFQ